ncbi:PA14 domain-containing protein [Streptomyces sp. UH6]|uniref:fibronectin type III domain-containing protein n=1 Tax=Streptomyces sp. UH6 TaxID=2748379 RepID=UPI00280B87D0|nr:PA14 domain-containing protein [Streptomyces sp. UH6]
MNRTSPARAATAAAVVLATTGGLLGAAATASSAAVTCASPVFKRQFFANTSFSGTPKKTDCDSKIDQNWGTGAPTSGLPSNNFGVRWSVTRDFGSGGPFTFTASSRDGIRLYLDGVRKVDLWKNVSTTVSKTVNLTIPSGKHSLRIDFVNWTGSANVKFAYTPRTTASVDKVKPLTPGGAALTYDTGTYRAKLSWTKSPEMDLAGYQVFRRVQGGSYPAKPLATTTSTSYTDTPPKDGKLYYYEVRAYDKAGNVSSGTADKGVTTVDRTGPAAPSGLVAATDLYGVQLHWNAVPDATRYEVLRQDPQTGERTKAGEVTGRTTLLDQAHFSGTYLVRGYDAAGNPGALSAPSVADGVDRTPPAAPYGLKALVRPGAVFLTFRTPELPLRDELDNDARVYVYRTHGTGADAETVEVRCNDDDVTYLDAPYSTDDGEMTFSCVDTSVAPDSTYTYTTGVTDGRGNPSARSTPVTVYTSDRTPPAPLTGLTATPRTDGVLLKWDVPDDDIASYRVMRGLTGEDGTVRWQEVSCTHVNGFLGARLCPGLPDGETALYSVRAVDEFGNVLAADDPGVATVTVTELVVLPGDPVVTASGPLTSSPRTGGPGVVPATWFCSGVADCAEITTYRVSRWDGDSYQYLGSVAGGTQSWIRYDDATQPAGTVSWYEVVGVRADGTELPAVHTYAVRYDQD